MTRQGLRDLYSELRRECIEYSYAAMNKNLSGVQDSMNRFRALATPDMVLSLIDDLMEAQRQKLIMKPKIIWTKISRGPR